MLRRALLLGLLIAILVGAASVWWQYSRARATRASLFEELTPIALANCELARYGNAHDGGYLLCSNLIARAQAAYSYGIDGRDEWGCHVGRELSITVNQYDCFNTTVPECPGVNAYFYPICVGPRPDIIDGRPYGTIGGQIAKNGDAGRQLLMKMDVEGSEWASFLATPDAVFQDVDQLVVEFHGVERPLFVDVVRRLKQFFYVANIHINNHSCAPAYDPFPAEVFEVLLVNKRIAQPSPAPRPTRDHPLDTPNEPRVHDCQHLTTTPELTMFREWFRRSVRNIVVGPRFAEP